MTKVIELLNAVKMIKGVESDYALAKELDLPRGHICQYYQGKRTPNEYACMQIAKALNRSIDEVMAPIRIEAEKDEKRRQKWREYYKSIGGYAAGLLLGFFALVTLIVTPTPAEAAPILEIVHQTLCIMLSVGAITTLLSTALNTPTNVAPRSCFSG